ncbi:MAG TPA: hypothetical protein VE860_14005 [Chthoniobacterales bacterium]|nr:hypothetical protein [Chthoniobacterales bacterium]
MTGEQGSAQRWRPDGDKAVADRPAPAQEQAHGERSDKRAESAEAQKTSRNKEYGNWNEEGPDFQVLAFITTNPQVWRTEEGL